MAKRSRNIRVYQKVNGILKANPPFTWEELVLIRKHFRQELKRAAIRLEDLKRIIYNIEQKCDPLHEWEYYICEKEYVLQDIQVYRTILKEIASYYKERYQQHLEDIRLATNEPDPLKNVGQYEPNDKRPLSADRDPRIYLGNDLTFGKVRYKECNSPRAISNQIKQDMIDGVQTVSMGEFFRKNPSHKKFIKPYRDLKRWKIWWRKQVKVQKWASAEN